MNRFALRPQRGICLLVCGLMLLQSVVPIASARAEVSGGVVVAGQAMIAPNGKMVKSQTDRTIINWNQFSIDAGDTFRIKQPGASSAVLNRVVTNNPSAIFGTLESNGNVLLINPNGILVGPSGVINTNGFTASVLDISNADFLDGGTLTFRGNSTARVINHGEITTKSGGAALIGGDVINTGTIESEGGSISLATGGTVTLADGSRFTHADLATIEAGLSPYAGVIRNSGTIRATGAIETGGEVYLINPGGNILNDGTIVVADASNGKGKGNNKNKGSDLNETLIAESDASAAVHIAGRNVRISGEIDTAERTGGDVVIHAAQRIHVADGAEISTGDNTTFLSARTVDLTAEIDGNVAGGGSYSGAGADAHRLRDPSRVNVLIGETTRGEIDQAVTVVADGGTVGLGPGEFDSFTVERPGLTFEGSGARTVVKTSSPAVTVAANNTTIQNMLLLGTGASGDIGILLDGIAVPGLTGTRVNNVLFFNLDDGIHTQGKIGDGVAGTLDLLVRNSWMRLIDNQGIDFRSLLSNNDSIRFIGNDIVSGEEAIRFRETINNSTINIIGNLLTSRDDNAIDFRRAINRSNVVIRGNGRIRGAEDAIDFDSIRNSQIAIVGNGRIQGGDDGIDTDSLVTGSRIFIVGNDLIRGNNGNGIEFDSLIGDSDITIANNDVVRGGENGIVFRAALLGSDVSISRNGRIIGEDDEGVLFDSLMIGSDVLISNNSLVRGGDDAIDLQSILNSQVIIAENGRIVGDDEAIDVDSFISNSNVAIVGNGRIRGNQGGIEFDGSINNSLISISGNRQILGKDGDAIEFARPIRGSLVTIGPTLVRINGVLRLFGGNQLIRGADNGIKVDQIDRSAFLVAGNQRIRALSGDGTGIEFDDSIEDSAVIILLNGSIHGGESGIEFDRSVEDSLVLIARNGRIIGDSEAGIQFNGSVDNSLVAIGGLLPSGGNGLIRGENDGIEFRGAIQDGSTVRINHNDRIVGNDDDGIAFDGRINDSRITIANNDSIHGQSRGIAFNNDVDDATVHIIRNHVKAESGDGILFNDSMEDANVAIIGNRVEAGSEGIDVEKMDGGRFLVLRNRIHSDGDGIEFEDDLEGSLVVLVAGNTIDAGGDGIRHENGSSIEENARVAYIGNVINVDGSSTGIRIANIDSSHPVLIHGGEINGGAFGIEVDQLNEEIDGRVIIHGVVVNDPTDSGIQFTNDEESSSLVILIKGVTINGGASADDNGLVFDGPGLALVGNTLNDLVLKGQNGNFIELRNGALFQPGMPTLIDATGVDFDGLNPTTVAGRQAIIDKIVDYLDNPTLGLIFPGAGLGDEQTYDRFTRYEDYFRTIYALLRRNIGTIFYPAPVAEVSEDLE